MVKTLTTDVGNNAQSPIWWTASVSCKVYYRGIVKSVKWPLALLFPEPHFRVSVMKTPNPGSKNHRFLKSHIFLVG